MATEAFVSQRTRVKMCGTTRIEDALAAVRLGVDALGFIFYPKSPRYIVPAKAAAIISNLPPFIDRVGVFVDTPLAEVVQTAGLGLSFLQLHGSESPDYCLELRALLPFCGIIKAFRVGAGSSGDAFTPYESCVDAFLLDTYVKGESGGTGLVFDWLIIDKLKLQRPVILAGGLSPENVALAIAAVRPYAVDVNSAIELQPGIKDHHRLQALMRVVAEIVCQ
ncbi:MAG: phosphoribosylanthranilate isomerase [Proteobacteria bacterium]|nr:phosphoribosylanthranilate isomerase [Pseudomonadota bacterium]